MGARRRQAALIGVAAVPMTAMFLFLLGIGLGVRGANVGVLALALITSVIALLPLAVGWGLEPERRHVLLTLFGIAYLLFFVMPLLPLHFFLEEKNIGGTTMSLTELLPREIIQGQVAALVGLLAFIGGYAVPIQRLRSRKAPRPRYDWTPQVTVTVAMAMVTTGWVIYLGGQFHLIPKRLGSGALGAVASSTIFGLGLLAIAYLRQGSRLALLLLALAIPPSMAFNALTGSKGRTLLPLLMPALAHILITRRVRTRWLVLLALLLVLMYPAAEIYRYEVLKGFRLGAADVIRNPKRAIAVMGQLGAAYRSFDEYLGHGLSASARRVDGLGRLAVIVRDTPSRVPFQNGRTLALIPMAYIPRIIWPGKPDIGIGGWVTANYGGGPGIRSATGPTWVGEFYLNFGYTCVVLGMLALGMAYRFAHERLLHPEAPAAAFLAAIVMARMLQSMGGGLVVTINGTIFFVAPLLLVHLALRRPVPDRTEQAAPPRGRLPGRTGTAPAGLRPLPPDLG
jgi:hypothetical protein